MVKVGLAEVLPAVGVTLSHAGPLPVFAAAVYVRGDPLEPIVTVCAAGALPPATPPNVRDVELTVNDPGTTVRVTGMVTGLLATAALFGPVADTRRLLLYVPAESRVGLANTVTVPDAVEPDCGETASQLPPVTGCTLIVKFNWSLGLVLARIMFWEGTEVAPRAAEKDTGVAGLINSAVPDTYSVTGMTKGLLGTATPLDATVAVNVRFPVHVPAGSPAGFTEMTTDEMDVAVVPLAAAVPPFSKSQLLPVQVVCETPAE
jgi:hypothetical protein